MVVWKVLRCMDRSPAFVHSQWKLGVLVHNSSALHFSEPDSPSVKIVVQTCGLLVNAENNSTHYNKHNIITCEMISY